MVEMLYKQMILCIVQDNRQPAYVEVVSDKVINVSDFLLSFNFLSLMLFVAIVVVQWFHAKSL